MTDKEKLEAIRAEIHRLVDVRGYDRGMAIDLFAFMNSLPNGPVSEDLEKAASRYAKEEYNHKSPATLPDRCRGCYAPLMYAFKAGAQWGKEQAEIQIKAQSMALPHGCPKEKPISEELEEAANSCSSCIYLEEVLSDDDKEVLKERLVNTFKEGAEWQKEHLIDKATEWLCHNYDKYIRVIGSSIYPAYAELCKDFQKAMEE